MFSLNEVKQTHQIPKPFAFMAISWRPVSPSCLRDGLVIDGQHVVKG